MPVNIRDAKWVLNPDHRYQPEKHKCGYVEVFAVAPGCFPVRVGSFYTTLWRGEVRFVSTKSRTPLKLDAAIAELRDGFFGNYNLAPMSPEVLAEVTRAAGEDSP